MATSANRSAGLAPSSQYPGRAARRGPPRPAGKAIKPKDIALLTRQLATMMKAGVPLLQSFDIVSRGSVNPRLSKLLADIRGDVETGTSLSAAFAKFPERFDRLYCHLVAAGETAGILDDLLDRLASHMEKTEALKSKIKSALMYPASVLMAAFAVVAIIMTLVIPEFKRTFGGAELPAATRAVIGISEFFVDHGWLILGALGGGIWLFLRAWQRNTRVQQAMDRALLRLPALGTLAAKSCVARWTRTLSTMFAAGVPLVEALDSAGGAAGNSVYAQATTKIRQQVSSGASLSAAMADAGLFPPMVVQMAAIGEESGSLDRMLGKAADFHEQEADDLAAGLSSLMEPAIVVFLGLVIGGIVVAMYLPMFKLGQFV
jgi:type IV pilus assembly protein PilC